MTTTTTVTRPAEFYNSGETRWYPYALSELAGVGTPDSQESPGAKFLAEVAESVYDAIERGEIDEDSPWAIADSSVPVYTHQLWLTFVDLAAYQEDVPTHSAGRQFDPDNTNSLASAALFMIGERLATELIEDYQSAQDEE